MSDAEPQPETAGARAVVLLSGGLDSATVLAIARAAGFACHAISFDYGQRHRMELNAAQAVARHLGVERHITVPIDLRMFGGSALTDDIPVPRRSAADLVTDSSPDSSTNSAIPITYVPARNTIFLSLALGWAEVLSARDIFIGANAVDYSGYPDCRPAFIEAFERLANVATRAGVEGESFRIHAPLINLTKAEIILRGSQLGVDYSLTTSCYDPAPNGAACGGCDSCILRQRGFEAAGVPDPTRYHQERAS